MSTNIFTKFLLLFFCLSFAKLNAQIFPISTGYVVNLENEANCLPIIVTEDRQVFEVAQSDLVLTPGDNITFARVSTQTTSSCVLSTQVVVYVISENSSGNSTDLCDYVDCVTPGDVNQDGMVDMVDMVLVHQNGGFSGMYRPNASTAFEPQYSQNWNSETYFGNNFKHLDTDGNGIILKEDLDVISQNYNLQADVESVQYPVLEGFYADIEFVEDEITLPNDYAGGNFNTSAIINIKGSGQVLSNVSAITFDIKHSEEDFIKTEDISFVQESPDFFVSEDEVPNKIFKKLATESNTLDLGLSSQVPEGKTGIGRIGKIDVIIVSDIIIARSEPVFPIDIEISDIKVLLNDGSIWTINTNNNSDQLNIIKDEFTDTENPTISESFGLSPNPVSDKLTLDLPDDFDRSVPSTVNIYNAAGKLVSTSVIDAYDQSAVKVEALNSGTYLLEIVNATYQARSTFVKF